MIFFMHTDVNMNINFLFPFYLQNCHIVYTLLHPAFLYLIYLGDNLSTLAELSHSIFNIIYYTETDPIFN